jgi:hypothetical protein
MINISVSKIVIGEGNKIFGTLEKENLHEFTNIKMHKIKDEI